MAKEDSDRLETSDRAIGVRRCAGGMRRANLLAMMADVVNNESSICEEGRSDHQGNNFSGVTAGVQEINCFRRGGSGI